MSSRGRAPPLSLLPAACALLLCAGCAAGPPPTKVAKEARHSNGLTVGVPEGFEARQTEDGFAVEPSGGKNRQHSQAAQSEASEPDFALCWALVGSARYRETR